MTDTPDFTALPPRPDPETGEPFPPHGRAWRGDDTLPEDDPDRETRLSHRPEPPPNKGPVLAWHKESGRGKVAGFLWSAAIIIGGGSILAVIDGDPPFAWFQYWQLWVVVVISSVLMSRPLTYVGVSAGADWFQLQLVRFGITTRRSYVDLYKLHSIKVDTGTARLFLNIADNIDTIGMATLYWQSDRRIWDLVYNGILHSVAAGAEVDRNARGFLELDRVPELRYPEGARQIDVIRLSDAHVWELMEDPVVRTMCDGLDFQGSAAEFRKLFPEFDEGMLANPANPEWFTTSAAHDTGRSDTNNEQ